MQTLDSTLDHGDVLRGRAQTHGTPVTGSTSPPPPRRHAKGLSLNFPILVPTNAQLSHSPPTGSGTSSPTQSARSSPPRLRPMAVRSPEVIPEDEGRDHDRGPRLPTSGTDYLTLLASQERKVLELREELGRAEAELVQLKRKWASHEASRKRNEANQVKKLQALALDDVAVGGPVSGDDEMDEERRRRRALVQRTHPLHHHHQHHHHHHITTPAPAAAATPGRRGSKRVFEGSRHTRTLSLLSPATINAAPVSKATKTMTGLPAEIHEADAADAGTHHTPSGRLTIDSLILGDPLPFGYGKTYKDLAAGGRSAPQGPTELLVKQGKQVYEGVREGLWTFFEDIRQATVGDEAIHGPVAQPRAARPHPKSSVSKGPAGSGKTAAQSKTTARPEPSFWREFGLDTPRRAAPGADPRPDASGRQPPQQQPQQQQQHQQHQQHQQYHQHNRHHHHQSNSSESTNPPSLLADVNEGIEAEADDGWEPWESPTSDGIVGSQPFSDPLRGPWAEHGCDESTPTRPARTVSDLMKEWEATSHGGEEDQACSSDSLGLTDRQAHLFSSPHI